MVEDNDTYVVGGVCDGTRSVNDHDNRPSSTNEILSPAYTMFNVFLPKLLETSDVPQTLEQSLQDVVIFTIGGCPGAIVCFFFFLFRPHI